MSRIAAWVVLILWVIVQAQTIQVRVPAWHDNLTLWTSTVAVLPCTARAHANLAKALAPWRRLAEHEWFLVYTLSVDRHACASLAP